MENKELENYYIDDLLPNKDKDSEKAEIEHIQEFYNVMSAAPILQATDLMGVGQEFLGRYPKIKKSISHSKQVTLTPNKKNKSLTVTTQKTNSKGEEQLIEITYSNLDLIKNTHGAAETIFILLLIEVGHMALSRGDLKQDYITFPLQLLVDMNIYQNINSARDGFKKCIKQILGIQIAGSLPDKKKNTPLVEGGGVLFTNWAIAGGQCFVYINTKFNWAFLTNAYTVIPYIYLSIPAADKRAAKIILYSCLLARQNLEDIKDITKKHFTISFKALYAREALPTTETKNPGRIITKGIIENINKAKEYAKDYLDFKIVYNPNDNWQNQLENGYVEVYPLNKYKDHLTEYAAKVEKKIKRIIAAKEKRIEEAKTRNLLKSMEKEAKDKKN